MCFPVFPQPTCPRDLTTSSVDAPTTITAICSNTADCPSLPWGKVWALSMITVTPATLGAAAILVQVQLEGMGIKMLAPPSTSGPRYSVKHYCIWSDFPGCCLGQCGGSTWKVRGINTSWRERWTLINGYGQSLADSFASFLPSRLFQDIVFHTAYILCGRHPVWPNNQLCIVVRLYQLYNMPLCICFSSSPASLPFLFHPWCPWIVSPSKTLACRLCLKTWLLGSIIIS